jgi:UDPglucose 6-dehydrogenase
LAEAGFSVAAVDPDADVVAGLQAGQPPIEEPGLRELIAADQAAGTLRFGPPSAQLLGDADIVWITFDTPVDQDDHADVEWVLERAQAALEHAARNALVVISAQLPVGSARTLQARMQARGRDDLRYASVPENLRLGKALQVFRSPDRYVAGVRSEEDAAQLGQVLERFGPVEWMSVESAEMTKHALNAFLATSVAFINEVAAICERVGADASEVARGLKSEQRIGPGAYLSPGDAFAGGTLARDIGFLTDLADTHTLPADVVSGVAASNAEHRNWARRALQRYFGADLNGHRIAVWGLTYKPGTDTLRRSSAIELCRWLASSGATIAAYDPAIRALPEELASAIELADNPLSAAEQAQALVVSTPWAEFRDVAPADVQRVMADPLVIDAGGHVQATLGQASGIRYTRVGVPAA